ncbi:NAD(P)-binding domain-containing protein [Arthrobacter sp. Y-9]|uniref:NADPH-dependent F420 reductase n=1 Tax=Arthrobacter sp. Y-9 TaxID=3039385 RepID=UPI00325B472E
MGRTLASAFADLGYTVTVGTRDRARTLADSERGEWLKDDPRIRLASFAEAAQSGRDLVVLATSGFAAADVLAQAGEALAGKVVLDVTNPLDFSQGFPPTLFVKDEDSLAEVLQRAHPEARIVKALNTLTASLMAAPGRLPEPGTIFLCGDDAEAKQVVTVILSELGHRDVLDLGALSAARGTEMLLPLWLRVMAALGTAEFTFKVVRHLEGEALS